MYEAVETSVKNLQAAQQQLVDFVDIASIEALIILFEVMLDQPEDDWQQLTETQHKIVLAKIKSANFDQLTQSEKRQVLQFLLVGTIHQDGLQANYQVTPDAIGMWVAFIADKFTTSQKQVVLKDIVLGTGNLLATTSQALKAAGKQVKNIGLENDDTMLTVASGIATLLEENWQMTLTDSVATPMTEDADIVIGDLPVGYYPKEVSENFVTKEQNGLTFVHHLLIEQSVRGLKPGGLAILTVPSNLFESAQSKNLLSYLQMNDVYLQGLIRLPNQLFKDPKMGKIILLLQRSGNQAQQAKPVMLAQTPELENELENKQFVMDLTTWMKENHLYTMSK